MKTLRSNINVLVAQKGHQERRRITLLTVAEETGIAKNTLYAIAKDTIERYPKETLVKLCEYFGCGIEELLLLEDG
jgi:DNA-binding Xre family transcriptional regulator